MPRAGRRRSAVWACFVENAESRKRRVLCRFCQHDIVANPARMVRHILKHCPNADEHHKKICSEYRALTVPLRRRPGELVDETGETSGTRRTPSPTLSFALAQRLAHSPLDASLLVESDERATEMRLDVTDHALAQRPESRQSPSVTERVHEDFALAIASSVDVFDVITHPRFQRALKILNVAPLTVKQVRDRLIPSIEAQIQVDTSAALQAATAITIQLTTMSFHKQSKFELFASDQDHRQVPLEALVPHSAINTNVCIHELMNWLPRKPQCQVYLCTDAFGNGDRPPVCANSAPSDLDAHCTRPLLVSPCMMQITLSLFGHVVDALPFVRRAWVSCEIVCEHIATKHHHEKSSEMVTDDLFDQWNSQRSGFLKLVEAVDLVKRHRAILEEISCGFVRQIIQNQEFWVGVELADDIIRPFVLLSTLSEAGQLTSSMFVVCWLLVWATVQHSSGPTQKEKVSVEAAVIAHIGAHGDLGLVCLMIDPRCRGLGLSAHGRRKARISLVEVALKLHPRMNSSRLVEHLVKYLNGESPFDDEASWQMMVSLPRLFWLEYVTEANELASLALATLNLRAFIHPLIQTWLLANQFQEGENVPERTGLLDRALRRVAARAEIIDKQTIERRKELIETTVRIGIATRGSDRLIHGECPSHVDESQVPDIDEFSKDSLVSRLAAAAKVVCPSRMNDSNSHVDASWFSVEDLSTLHQLRDCLHHALFGDIAETRSTESAQVSASSSPRP